jgi:hypothetical protein
MIVGTVFTRLVSTLELNPTLKAYLKYVYQGLRFEIPKDSLPCICVEPVRNGEVETDMNNSQRLYANFDIYAFVYSPLNQEKCIVGDSNYKGILDIDQDIRACLAASYELGCAALDVKVDVTDFAYLKEYDVRGLVIPIRVLYTQTNNA